MSESKPVRIDKALYEEARERYIDHAYLQTKRGKDWSPTTDKKIIEKLIRLGLRVLEKQIHQNAKTILTKGITA